MLIKNSLLRWMSAILLLLLIIFMIGQIDFFLDPFKKLVATLFAPILLSGVLYYMLRPLVRMLVKIRVHKLLAIIIVIIVTTLVAILLGTYAGAVVGTQLNELISNLPGIIKNASDKLGDVAKNQGYLAPYVENIDKQIGANIQNTIPQLGRSFFDVVSIITNAATVILVIPFILFFFLKEDNEFVVQIIQKTPVKFRGSVKDVMEDVDDTISTYIIGQIIMALLLGVMMYIGYLVIGLPYAAILAVFALIASLIPLFGSIIGVIPALFVGMAINPFMAVKILIIMLIAQQLQSSIIGPLLIGKRMNIHPLTLILLFIVAGALYGFIGMLLCVPAYGVLKIFIGSGLKLFRLWRIKRAESD
jgi:predicted PurR-regulated permease PerM